LLSDRPEKLYATYLENRYKQLVGHPKWAKLGEKNDDIDDLDILKVSFNILNFYFYFYRVYFIIFSFFCLA